MLYSIKNAPVKNALSPSAVKYSLLLHLSETKPKHVIQELVKLPPNELFSTLNLKLFTHSTPLSTQNAISNK